VVISAVEIVSDTFPKYLAYATNVSGCCDMYVLRNPDFCATGSDILVLTRLEKGGRWGNEQGEYIKASSLAVRSSWKQALLNLHVEKEAEPIYVEVTTSSDR
jgi:hypothetical protein